MRDLRSSSPVQKSPRSDRQFPDSGGDSMPAAETDAWGSSSLQEVFLIARFVLVTSYLAIVVSSVDFILR
jgi:hypothetical protein